MTDGVVLAIDDGMTAFTDVTAAVLDVDLAFNVQPSQSAWKHAMLLVGWLGHTHYVQDVGNKSLHILLAREGCRMPRNLPS